jgi:hypothetical protein
MHDAFGVRLHAGKQAEVCHCHLILIYGLVFKEKTTFSAKLLFGFSYIDKFSAIGIKICIFSWVMSALSWVDVMAASCMDDERVSGEVREQEDDDDKVPQLSAAAMEALREFLAGQHRPKEHNEAGGGEDGVELVPEDWRLSQFWYDERTARELVEEVVRLVSPSGSGSVAGVMACIACLTLYAYLKKTDPGVPAQLLEYDERFGQYGCDFTFYDDNRPEELPAAMKHAYRVIVADPPYLVLFLPYQRLPIKKCLISC